MFDLIHPLTLNHHNDIENFHFRALQTRRSERVINLDARAILPLL